MFISCSDFNQNILGIEGNLGAIRIDDRRKRTNSALGIENDGIDGGITNDMKELTEMLILLHNKTFCINKCRCLNVIAN